MDETEEPFLELNESGGGGTGRIPTMSSGSNSDLSRRIHAIRGEVINALSFLSVLSSLWSEETVSFLSVMFQLAGLIILGIDCYFIRCQWRLQTSHALPVVCAALVGRGQSSVGALDDLVADLPQSIWVLAYLFTFKFSLIAMVCALHSTFSIVEGVIKLRT